MRKQNLSDPVKSDIFHVNARLLLFVVKSHDFQKQLVAIFYQLLHR